MAVLGISTWSLHRTLGRTYPGLATGPEPRSTDDRFGRGEATLVDIPAMAATLGATHLDICHFHFPRTDADYLQDVRACLQAAGISTATLLIDDGDIASADDATRQRDLAGIQAWIDVAAAIGATHVRVIAGKSTGDGAIERSAAGLSALATYAEARSVDVITENWLALASTPPAIQAILDKTTGHIGLCVDFGNFKGSSKYADLAAIMPRGSAIHAKANVSESGVLDRTDFDRCLNLAHAAGVAGPYVLIFDGVGDERAALTEMARIVSPYLS